MSDTTSKTDCIKQNILNQVTGYQAGAEQMLQRAEVGTDKSEFKGKVTSQVAKLHPKRLVLTVDQIIQETASTKTFRLVSHEQTLPPFQAGQYINLWVEIDGVKSARPYAISSCPTHRGYYDLTVKIVDKGFVTGYLLGNHVTEGQQFIATSPMGSFYHNPLFHGNDLVFLAGGSGAAPARSMIQNVLNRGLDINYHLIYGNSHEDDIIFAETFREMAANHDNFSLTEVISRPAESYVGLTGYLTKELISKVLGEVKDQTFYVCGPTPFNDYCKEQLKAMGVADKRIRMECNGPPKKPSKVSGWPQVINENKAVMVTVKGKGQFRAKAGEPLLNSLERNGYSVENACRSGECSLCRVKVLAGDVFNPPETRLRQSDKDFGWVHSCVAFPLSDIEITF